MRPDYMANGERMHAFADAVTSYRDGSVKSVTISAGAAPDGNTKFNQKLSEARAQSLRSFFISNFTTMQLSSDQFTLFALGEDWDGLLEALQDVDEPWRDQAADIIRNTPVWVMDASGKVVDGRKKRLKNLSGGRAWRYLEQHVFQDLRWTDNHCCLRRYAGSCDHTLTPSFHKRYGFRNGTGYGLCAGSFPCRGAIRNA